MPLPANGARRRMIHDNSSSLCPRARSARPRDPAGLDACLRQPGAGDGAVRRADPVRPHHRLAGRRARRRAQACPGRDLLPLLGAWVGFGLFTIVCSTLVALHADRLAHRRRQAVRTEFFEHVLQLPLSFHGATHSGRLMKVMLTGTDTLWGLWLAFFREHFAALLSLIVLLPLSLFSIGGSALLLIVLCLVFAMLIALVLRQDRGAAKHGRALLLAIWPSAPPTRSATSRWCRASPASSTKSAACATWATSCSARRSRCCPGGRWRPCSREPPPR